MCRSQTSEFSIGTIFHGMLRPERFYVLQAADIVPKAIEDVDL